MKISELIERIEKQRPDLNYSNEEYLDMIYSLYDEIYLNVFATHENCPNKKTRLCLNDELELPNRYCDLYFYYLLSQLDFANADITRYSNDMIIFNRLFEEFEKYYNRNNLPLLKNTVGGY